MKKIKKLNSIDLNFQFIINISFLLVILLLMFLCLKDKNKIVYANTQRLLLEYKGSFQSQSIIKSKMAQLQSNLDTLNLDLNKLANEIKINYSKYSKKQKDEKIRLLQFKERQLDLYKSRISENLKKEEENLRNNVLVEMNNKIIEYGKKKNYKYIIGANPDGTLLYADDILDITDELLTELNSTYQFKSK